MRKVLGFVPIVLYSLGFLLFGGLSLLFALAAGSAGDPGVAVSGAYLLVFIGPVAIVLAAILLIKILHLTTRFALFGIICTGVDLLFSVSSVRLLISYMTDSIPFGSYEVMLMVLSALSILSFVANLKSIKS